MVYLKRLFFFGASCSIGLVVLRQRNIRRLRLSILKSKVIDIGRFFGMDIGGTLTKLVYFCAKDDAKINRRPKGVQHAVQDIEDFILSKTSYGGSGVREDKLVLYSEQLGGELHFIRFETRKIEQSIKYVLANHLHRCIMSIRCSGGGSLKYSRLFEEELGISLEKVDEVDSLIKGLNFVLRNSPDERYTWKNVTLNRSGMGTAKMEIRPFDESLYPFLVVNIGSGVSILKVESETSYARVSGTSLGGGTFWGICRLLTQCQTFDDAMHSTMSGDNGFVDMMVGDIYGGNYDKGSLSSSTLASSFGKMVMKEDPREGINEEDLSRSLLVMITQNIGHVAYLNALRHGTNKIFFVGNFLRLNEIASRLLAYAIDYWSKSTMEAQFLKHEGYFGALGAFLQPKV